MLLERVFEVRNAQTTKKLSGYEADHYLVRFRDNKPLDNRGAALFEQQEDDVVEVQVVTIFAHTWSQVEHKLKYKRKTYTPLSTTENRMLQGLSGVVATGDYLLDELYDRQQENVRPFADEYDLGGWLWKNIPEDAPLCMGEYRATDQKVLFAFLNVFGLTRPNDLGHYLNEICPYEKTPEFERKIKEKLRNLREKYNLSTSRTSICLMDHILTATPKADCDLILQNFEGRPTREAYRCITVLNALLWLHELFDHKNDNDESYKILTEFRNRGTNEKASVKWAYTNISRAYIARGDEPGRGDGEKLDLLWKWMETADRPALKLVFQIAQLGVWQGPADPLRVREGPVDQVIRQLGPFKPLEIISRESTGTVEEGRT